MSIPGAIESIVRAGHLAPSPDNGQPWMFNWDGESLHLYFGGGAEFSRIFGDTGHCECLTMGAVAENMIQYARHLGLDGSWDIEPTRSPCLSFRPKQAQTGVLDEPPHPIFERHTNRFAFLQKPLEAALVSTMLEAREGDCKLKYFCGQGQVNSVSELTRKASSLRFRNEKLHSWFASSLRYTPREVALGTGLDVATIELPPGGRMFLKFISDWATMSFLNRARLYALMALIESKAIRKSSGVVAVVGPRNAAFDAGRLMERVWLQLTAEGVSAQPYYVVPDQLVRLRHNDLPQELIEDAELMKAMSDVILGDKVFPHMLLRVGYPAVDPVRARRTSLSGRLRDSSVDGTSIRDGD